MAELVAGVMLEQGIACVVIRVVALAAYRHVRYTEDLNLSINADLPALRRIAPDLAKRGWRVALREPDAQDPFRGVKMWESSSGLVQIISFADRFSAVIEDAIHRATLFSRPQSARRIAPVPHLIALKPMPVE